MGVGSYRRGNRTLAAGKGFTLTELLVVIVIIGVLAAIVYPIMIKVKETAKITQCLSNMRQIGAAVHMYFDQYDDRFPSAASAGSPTYWDEYGCKTIQELLTPYIRNGMRGKTVNGKTTYDGGSVFCCPSDAGLTVDELGTDQGLYGIYPDRPVWTYTGCSYLYYSDDQVDRFAQNPNSPPIKWTALSPAINSRSRMGAPYSSVVAPTRKAVLGDIGFWHMGDRIPGPRIAYVNTLFADGHSARVRGGEHNDARILALRPWCSGY